MIPRAVALSAVDFHQDEDRPISQDEAQGEKGRELLPTRELTVALDPQKGSLQGEESKRDRRPTPLPKASESEWRPAKRIPLESGDFAKN